MDLSFLLRIRTGTTSVLTRNFISRAFPSCNAAASFPHLFHFSLVFAFPQTTANSPSVCTSKRPRGESSWGMGGRAEQGEEELIRRGIARGRANTPGHGRRYGARRVVGVRRPLCCLRHNLPKHLRRTSIGRAAEKFNRSGILFSQYRNLGPSPARDNGRVRKRGGMKERERKGRKEAVGKR